MSKSGPAIPVLPVVLFAAAAMFSALPAASADGVPIGMMPADTGHARARGTVAVLGTPVADGASRVDATAKPDATSAGFTVLGTPVDMPAAFDRREVATTNALDVLAPLVGPTSTTDALRVAFQAYHNHRAAHPDEVSNPYFYFVDFGLDNATPRGWVFDMDRMEIVEGPFPVSHGRGSLKPRDGVPQRFSNTPGSYQTSLGLYVAQETYTFRGTAGGGRYSSIGLRMRGESGDFNDAARRRGIVAHGAPYVTARSAGRSEGCPAMEQERARRLLPLLANGGVVFIYSPHAADWLEKDPWVNAA